MSADNKTVDEPSLYDIADIVKSDPDPLASAATSPEPLPVAPGAAAGQVPAAVLPAGTTAEPPVAAEPPKHSGRLLNLARELDIDDETIAESSPQELERLVYQLNVQALKQRKEFRENEQRAAHGIRTQQAPAVPAPQPAPPPEPEFDWGEVEEKNAEGKTVRRKITDDEVDPVFANIVKRQAKELAELREQYKQLAQREGRKVAESTNDMVDRVFLETSPEYFGEQNWRDLVEGEPETERRLACLARAKSLAERKPDVPFEQHLRKAIELLYGIKSPEPQQPRQPQGRRPQPNPGVHAVPRPNGRQNGAHQQVSRIGSNGEPIAVAGFGKSNGAVSGITLDQWNGGAVAEPTQRTAPELPVGRQRAYNTLRNGLANIAANADDSEELGDDFVP